MARFTMEQMLDELRTIFLYEADHIAMGAGEEAARKRLTRHLGGERGLRMVEPWLSVYAVIADDACLVTVAHQHHRHRRE